MSDIPKKANDPARDLRKVEVIDDRTMRAMDELCLPENKVRTDEQELELKALEGMSLIGKHDGVLEDELWELLEGDDASE